MINKKKKKLEYTHIILDTDTKNKLDLGLFKLQLKEKKTISRNKFVQIILDFYLKNFKK